jgi:hypothetical protein
MKPDQQMKSGPGRGVAKGAQRQFVIVIDNETADQVIARANREGTSTAAQIRLLIEWGLGAGEA